MIIGGPGPTVLGVSLGEEHVALVEAIAAVRIGGCLSTDRQVGSSFERIWWTRHRNRSQMETLGGKVAAGQGDAYGRRINGTFQ